ncbi:MAG: YhcH/YjgK/YiaL family protein [Candidatus Cryptobacteroides sp.]
MKKIHDILATLGILLFSSCTNKSDKVPAIFQNAEMSPEGKEALAREYKAGKATWDAALAFIERNDLATMEAGIHEIPGTKAFVNVIDYETRFDGDFEYHRKYIDVQYIVSGGEKCIVLPLTDLTVNIEDYKEGDDYGMMNGPAEGARIQEIVLNQGMVGIYFTFDAHKPNMAVGETTEKSRKIVVKIPVAGR